MAQTEAARNNTSGQFARSKVPAEAQQAMQALQDNISTMQAAVKALEPGSQEQQQQAAAQMLLALMEGNLALVEAHLAAAAAADGQGSSAEAASQIMHEKVPQQLATIVVAVMKRRELRQTAAQLLCSFVPVLTKLKRAQEEHLVQQLGADTYQQAKLLAEFSAALVAQLQKAGLLRLLPDLLLQWQHVGRCLSDCPMCAGADILGAAKPVAAAATAAGLPSMAAAHSGHTAAVQSGPAAAASGADGPDKQPVSSCVPLTLAALLRACSQLLHCCPGCVAEEDPAVNDWVPTAAQVAGQRLQQISMHVQHQQQQQPLQQEQELLQEPCNAGGYCIQAPPPPAVLQLGWSSLDMLAALAFAVQKELGPGLVLTMHLDAQDGKQVMMGRPCILHGLAAVAAAAVLGWELLHRLRHHNAICSSSGGSSSDSKSGNDTSCTADQGLDSAALRDQSSSSSSESAGSPGSKGAGGGAAAAPRAGVLGQAQQVATLLSATSEAIWQLVCHTEDCAHGQLLPRPFTMLLEGLSCSPKVLLWLAGVWLQEEATSELEARGQTQQQRAEQQQQQEQQQRGEQQQQCEVSEIHWALSRVLLRACSAYRDVSDIQSPDSAQATAAKNKRPPAAKEQQQQQQEEQMVQHLLMSMLLLRWVARWGLQGVFQPSGTEPELRRCVWGAVGAARKCQGLWLQQQKEIAAAAAGSSSSSSSRGQTAAATDYRRWHMKWASGGVSSSAVLSEGLQVHVLLLRQCVQQLQKRVSSCSDCRCSISSKHSTLPPSEAFLLDVDPATSDAAKATEEALQYAGCALRHLEGAAVAAVAAAAAAPAADVDVLQKCRPLLFELAGLLSTCFRCRGQCHKPGRVLFGDKELLELFRQLVLGTGSNSEEAGSAGQSHQQQQGPAAAAATTAAGVRACGLLPYLATTAPAGGKEQQQLLDLLLSALKFYAAHSDSLYTRVYKVSIQPGWLAGACDAVRAACWASRLILASWQPGPSAVAAASGASGSAGGQQSRASSSSSGCAAAAAGGFAAVLPWLVLLGRALQLWVQLFNMYVQLPPAAAAAAEGSAAAQRGNSALVGSMKALVLLSGVVEDSLQPSLQSLGVVLSVPSYPDFEVQQLQKLMHCITQLVNEQKDMQLADYGIPACVCPAADMMSRFTAVGRQLLQHCQEQRLTFGPAVAVTKQLMEAVNSATPLLIRTFRSLRDQPGSPLATFAQQQRQQQQQKFRQSDIRRQVQSWKIDSPAVLQDVITMLRGRQVSLADTAVAAWLCSPCVSTGFISALTQLSGLFSNLPFHEACNNPTCCNLSGGSDQGLVCGKSCLCGDCRAAHYCSRRCQREHWPLHKQQCRGRKGA